MGDFLGNQKQTSEAKIINTTQKKIPTKRKLLKLFFLLKSHKNTHTNKIQTTHKHTRPKQKKTKEPEKAKIRTRKEKENRT
jgi:hypothetical protein